MRAESGGPLVVSLPGLVGGPFRKHEKEARRGGAHPCFVSSGLNVPTIQADDCVASNAKGLFVPPPPRWPRRVVRVADWGEVYQNRGRGATPVLPAPPVRGRFYREKREKRERFVCGLCPARSTPPGTPRHPPLGGGLEQKRRDGGAAWRKGVYTLSTDAAGTI